MLFKIIPGRNQMIVLVMVFSFFISLSSSAQNVGINQPNPQATLDVNGTVKTNLLRVAGGNQFDFLVTTNANGDVGFRKGHQAQAIRYYICIQGIFPFDGMEISEPYIGQIIMTAFVNPNVVPANFLPCEGQILSRTTHFALFSVIGGGFGGDGSTTFALPDMRGTTPIGTGNGWAHGQRSN